MEESHSTKIAMPIKLKRATKRIPRFGSNAARGGVYAVEIQPSAYGYFFNIHDAVGVYPIVSKNSVLPVTFFSPKTWRWLLWPWMHFPQNAQFLGRLEITDDDVTEPEYYQHYTNTLSGPNAFVIVRRDGTFDPAEAIDCLGIPKYSRSLDLAADMLAFLPQMMVVDGVMNVQANQ